MCPTAQACSGAEGLVGRECFLAGLGHGLATSARLHRQALAANLPAMSQDLTTVCRRHALAETVSALAALDVGLVGHFHGSNSL